MMMSCMIWSLSFACVKRLYGSFGHSLHDGISMLCCVW